MSSLTIHEVAERLRLHPESVRRLIQSGELPAMILGGSARQRKTYRIDEEVFEAWVRRRSGAQPEPQEVAR